MRRLIVLLFKIILIAASITGCSYSETGMQPTQTQEAVLTQQPEVAQQPDESSQMAAVVNLTASEAKTRIDSEEGIIIVDVREQDEYDEQHILDAILLPVNNINKDAADVIPDKDTVYFIYCRSGNRSATAAAQLVGMGYKNIYDFGGIIDWPYEMVSE